MKKESQGHPNFIAKSTGETVRAVDKVVAEKRKAACHRFPLVFTLLGTFGVVATLYGFERIIDDIPLFADSPYILLIFGLLVLAFTGTLYRKLGD